MGKTLLLADDSVTIQKVVGISFASEDISITTVDNGDDAVARARELHPDVVLADVVMPGRSGYDVCEAIKADPDLAHIPVLLLTGTFEAFDEEHASRVGAAGHVAKPFEAQTLVDRVKELLSAPPPAPPAPEPVAPPAPEPVAVAPPEMHAPVAETANPDNSFDFFDDNLDDLSSSSPHLASPSPSPTMAPTTSGSGDPLDFDGPDAAFAFGEEDLAAATQEPMPAPPLPASPAAEAKDATVAILPPEVGESGVAVGPSLDPELLNAPTEAPRPVSAPEPLPNPMAPPPPEPAAPSPQLDPVAPPEPMHTAPPEPDVEPAPQPQAPPPMTPRAADDFDFEFETVKPGGAASAAVSSADLAQASVLDPSAGSDYDVSSSDLGTPVEAPPPAAATQVIEAPVPASAPNGPPSISGLSDDPGLPNDPVMDLLSPETVDPNEATLDPARGAAATPAPPSAPAPAPELEPPPAPGLESAQGTPLDDLESQTEPGPTDLDLPPAPIAEAPPMPEPSMDEARAEEPLRAEPAMEEPAMLAVPEPVATPMQTEAPAEPMFEHAAPAAPAEPMFEHAAPAAPAEPMFEHAAPAAPAEPMFEHAAPAAPAEPMFEHAAPEPSPDLEPEPVETPYVPVADSEPSADPDWAAVPPLEDEEPLDAEPQSAEAAASRSIDLEEVMEQVGPALRAQIHETLERIAWESFGQITEKLVEQSLERIEKIAWEVVPKLAETLIQEEIRKLKNDE